MIKIGGKSLRGCVACYKCMEKDEEALANMQDLGETFVWLLQKLHSGD